MTWVPTELLLLWLGLPLLLWLEARPPTLRIGIRAAAAVLRLWIVRREGVPNSVVFAVAHLVYGSGLTAILAVAGRLVLAGGSGRIRPARQATPQEG